MNTGRRPKRGRTTRKHAVLLCEIVVVFRQNVVFALRKIVAGMFRPGLCPFQTQSGQETASPLEIDAIIAQNRRARARRFSPIVHTVSELYQTGVSEKENIVTFTPVGARISFTTFSHSSVTMQAMTTASTLSALMTSGASLIVP